MKAAVIGIVAGLSILAGPAMAETLVSGSATVIAPGQLMVGGKAVQLDDVRMPGPKATCSEWRGQRQVAFACNEHAEAFLKSLIAGRDVSCVARDGGIGTCYADGKDLAATLVTAGWASGCGQTTRYVDLEVAARNARHGMWAGNFTLDTQCPAPVK